MYIISAAELRIGNWFIDAFAGKTQVRGIDLDDWEAINSTPIKLTSEILEQCGFESGGYLMIDEQSLLYHDGIIFIHGQDSSTSGQAFTCTCNYLHQLQNLYFALTGKELVWQSQSAKI